MAEDQHADAEVRESSGEPSGEPPVLVPVDLSPHSRAAVLFAADLAERYGAPLLLLHVIHDPVDSPGFYRSDAEQSGEEAPLRTMDQSAAAAFATWLADLRGHHPELRALASAETRLVRGIPAGRILEVATDERARMIVMGSLGRTGLPHLLLGSNAQRVARLARIPVTIVKPEPEDAE